MASMPPPGPPQPPSGPPGAPYRAGPPAYAPPQFAAAPASAGTVAKRTGTLLLAQVVAILEGIIFLLAGVGIILLGVVFRDTLNRQILNNPNFAPNVDVNTVANAATGIFIGFGVFIIIYFAFFIWAAVIAGRPSTGGRVTVIVLDVILVLLSLASFRGSSTTLNSGNTYLLGHIVFWALQAIVIFGMAFHATRRLAVVAPARR